MTEEDLEYLKHLPFHLAEAGLHDELLDLARDSDYRATFHLSEEETSRILERERDAETKSENFSENTDFLYF